VAVTRFLKNNERIGGKMNTGNHGRLFLAAYLLELIRIKDYPEQERQQAIEAFAENWLQREPMPTNSAYADFTSNRTKYGSRYSW
jgi:hypothetical protein